MKRLFLRNYFDFFLFLKKSTKILHFKTITKNIKKSNVERCRKLFEINSAKRYNKRKNVINIKFLIKYTLKKHVYRV